MFDDIYQEISNVTDTHRESVYERFIAIARHNKDELNNFISSIPLDDSCMLFELYEALSQYTLEFEECLESELNRLLEIAQIEPQNSIVFQSLEAYTFVISNDHGDLSQKVKNIFINNLDSKHPSIRRFSTWMLGDYLKSDPRIKVLLMEKLKSDIDLRVRIIASTNLLDLDPQNDKFKLNILDRMKALFLGANKCKYTGL